MYISVIQETLRLVDNLGLKSIGTHYQDYLGRQQVLHKSDFILLFRR